MVKQFISLILILISVQAFGMVQNRPGERMIKLSIQETPDAAVRVLEVPVRLARRVGTLYQMLLLPGILEQGLSFVPIEHDGRMISPVVTVRRWQLIEPLLERIDHRDRQGLVNDMRNADTGRLRELLVVADFLDIPVILDIAINEYVRRNPGVTREDIFEMILRAPEQLGT